MFKLLKLLVEPLVTIVALPWILSRLRKPNDFQRAQVIKEIADAVAAQIVREFPTAEWPLLLRRIIATLGAALPAGYRTTNVAVIERAATLALSKIRPI